MQHILLFLPLVSFKPAALGVAPIDKAAAAEMPIAVYCLIQAKSSICILSAL
jgi:hypothetical protein